MCSYIVILSPRTPTLFPYTTLFRSAVARIGGVDAGQRGGERVRQPVAGHGVLVGHARGQQPAVVLEDRKSTRLNSSHSQISYAVFCLKKKKGARPSPADRKYSVDSS